MIICTRNHNAWNCTDQFLKLNTYKMLSPYGTTTIIGQRNRESQLAKRNQDRTGLITASDVAAQHLCSQMTAKTRKGEYLYTNTARTHCPSQSATWCAKEGSHPQSRH
jgi:hypothetical protein